MFLKYAISALLLLQYTLSVDVDLVVFNVTVLDKNGRTVNGLDTTNFRIFEEGREETIKLFHAEDTPSTVGLVIDNSSSMSNKRQDVVTAALAFIGARHADDEMFIVNF